MIWQSGDGTWGRGFYTVVWTGDDPECDVEYDYGSFEWASMGHPDEDAAHDSWKGSNTGGFTMYPYEGNETYCDNFDIMAQRCLDRLAKHNDWPVHSGLPCWARRW